MLIVSPGNEDRLLPQRVQPGDRARGTRCDGVIAVGDAPERPDHLQPVLDAAKTLRHGAAVIVRHNAVRRRERRHIVFYVM